MKQETTEYTNVNLMNYHCGRAMAQRQFKYCVTRHLMHKSNTLLAYKFFSCFCLLRSIFYLISKIEYCVRIHYEKIHVSNEYGNFSNFLHRFCFQWRKRKAEWEWKRAYDISINHSSELAAMVESFISEGRVRMS